MKRGEPKLPRGPKPKRVNPAQEIKLAERVANMVLMRLRAEAPQLFTNPQALSKPPATPAPVEGARA